MLYIQQSTSTCELIVRRGELTIDADAGLQCGSLRAAVLSFSERISLIFCKGNVWIALRSCIGATDED